MTLSAQMVALGKQDKCKRSTLQKYTVHEIKVLTGNANNIRSAVLNDFQLYFSISHPKIMGESFFFFYMPKNRKTV